MKRLLAGVVLGSLILLLSGCASTPNRGLLMARFHDIKPDASPKATDLFGPGEVPSAYVYGYDGQTVTIEIFDITNMPMDELFSLLRRQHEFFLSTLNVGEIGQQAEIPNE